MSAEYMTGNPDGVERTFEYIKDAPVPSLSTAPCYVQLSPDGFKYPGMVVTTATDRPDLGIDIAVYIHRQGGWEMLTDEAHQITWPTNVNAKP